MGQGGTVGRFLAWALHIPVPSLAAFGRFGWFIAQALGRFSWFLAQALGTGFLHRVERQGLGLEVRGVPVHCNSGYPDERRLGAVGSPRKRWLTGGERFGTPDREESFSAREGKDCRAAALARWPLGLAVAALAGVLAFGATGAAAEQAEDIIASLQNLTGEVQVMQKATGAMVPGRAGLLLHAGDTIVTADQSRATIKFRDGSEIRLFQNTRFVLQGAKESAGSNRSFKLDLLLQAGSLWGNLVKQRQTAKLTGPTATVGIKGTTLRYTERDNKARVALTEGLIDVSNEAKTVELRAGFRLTEFTRSDDLAQKVQPIPYKVDIKADKRQLTFEKNQPETVFVNLQLIEIATGRAVPRSAKIYLRSNYERITYPAAAQLDERGFTRVSLTFAPPEPSDTSLNGSVFVWAVVDQDDADDTGEGRALFTIPVPSGKDRVRIEADKGETQRVQ